MKTQPLNDYTAEDQALWDSITGPGLYDVVGRPAVSYLTWKRLPALIDDPYNRGKQVAVIGDLDDRRGFGEALLEDGLSDDDFTFYKDKEDNRIGADVPFSLRSEDDAEELRNEIAGGTIGAVVLLYQEGKLQHLNRILDVPVYQGRVQVKSRRIPVFHVREVIEVDKDGRAHNKRKSFIKAGVEASQPAVISSSRDFSNKDFDTPEVMLEVTKSGSPVLHHPSMGEVHAYRGVGKTNLTLGLLNALATGGEFLCYKATRCFRTIDFDGEMDGGDLQEALSLLAEENDNFHMVARCEQPDNFMPSMATEQGLVWYEEAINRCKADVAVFDNWSTLANIGTNEEEAFFVFTAWARKMRLSGVTIIYLHHDGKDKHTQRGHSKPEDPLNWVIGLTWPPGYEGQEQLKIILKFEKCRRPVREHNKIAVTLEPDGTWCWGEVGAENKQTTGRPAKEITPEQLVKLKELIAEKASVRSISRELKISWEVASRWCEKSLNKKGTLPFDDPVSKENEQ